MTRPASPVRRIAALVLYNIAAVLVLLLVLEGVASVLNSFHESFASKPLAERRHTEYDRELGWVNLPNVYLPNMYGRGKYLRTNSQRFRNSEDFTLQVPQGKTRIICSGDSFTLGYGVDNDHTWPQLLASRNPNIETVNMGQGGYGADQAYLWYKRDAALLDHNIQILALISPDLYRMQSKTFAGYGKPTLEVENERLVTKNVPVPRPLEALSPRLARATDALANLNLTRFLRRVFKLDTDEAVTETRKERNQETSVVLSAMLDDLLATNRARNSVLVLAYLPTRVEYGGDLGASWRRFLAQYAQQRGIPFLDLAGDFHRLPPDELDKLFIARGAIEEYTGAAGHYTEAGNAFIADLIYQRLLANPETAAKLHARETSSATSRGP
jgi:hypothetical protein